MTDNQITEVINKLYVEISGLNANSCIALSKIEALENRVGKLEDGRTGHTSQLVMFLVKALIIALVIIGSITGAGNLMKEMVCQASLVSHATQASAMGGQGK